jgi:hypothetical protein
VSNNISSLYHQLVTALLVPGATYLKKTLSSDLIGMIEKKPAVAKSRFPVLTDRYNDRLNMMVAIHTHRPVELPPGHEEAGGRLFGASISGARASPTPAT